MKKVVRLTESQLINIIKSVVTESEGTKPTLLGRYYRINNDYTLSIQDKNNQYPKIKLSGKKLLMTFEINVKEIKQNGKDYTITTKKGNVYDLTEDTVRKIIRFVDTNQPSEIDLGKATMILKKV